MISYTKNIEQENEFIQSSISIGSNTEENNTFLTHNFPSDETICQDSINLEDFDNSSIYNMLKSIYEKEKESGIKNKIDCTFLINRETPPVLLTKDISLYLINEIDIGKKIKNILNNESYLKNNAIEMIEKQLINKEDIKSNDKKNREKHLFNKKRKNLLIYLKTNSGKGGRPLMMKQLEIITNILRIML